MRLPHPRYPDPELLDALRPTSAPPAFTPELTSRAAGRMYPIHAHTAFINPDGTGVTDVVASHFHRIKDGRVLPDHSDGHTHNLTGLPAGAG